MKKKTTLTLWISPNVEDQEGIYRHQENGGQGDKRWPEVLAQRRQYSRENEAKAAFSRLYRISAAVLGRRSQCRLLRAARLYPYWLYVLVSGFRPPVLMKPSSKVIGYLYRLLITN